MNYLSVCSGIESATCAWHDLGWKPVGFSEIEPFPSAVLKHHYPDVPNFGDMTKYKEWNINEPIELLVGGTPCQSFSVAGLRKGLDDPRGNLALTYVGILDKFKPKWCVWENVPGVLSSNGGRDFGSFLGALAELGYGFAYRVLDAQNFGVPQRRRRVFVVGCLGDWESAAKVLFESDCLSGDNQKSKVKKQAITTYSERGVAYGGSDGECADTVTSKWAKGSGGPSGNECGLFVAHKVYETHPADSRVKEMGEVCQTVTSRWGTGGGNVPLVQAYSIREDAKANNFSATPLEVTPALQAMQPSVQSHHAQTFIAGNMAVRRLTPRECERLQGFKDVKNSCIINVWSTENQKNYANVEEKSHRSLKLVGSAESTDQVEIVSFAEQISRSRLQLTSKPVALTVQLDLERKSLVILNQEKLPLYVNTAKEQSWFHHQVQQDDFVLLIAKLSTLLEIKTQHGKGELLPNDSSFSHHLSGRKYVNLCGQEIKELAEDVEKFTQKMSECLKSITSEVGENSQNLDILYQTLCSCVGAAISGFIQEQMWEKSLFSIEVEVTKGYTIIPWKKGESPDGHRYKALGNSMAVPVMAWIGKRIGEINETNK